MVSQFERVARVIIFINGIASYVMNMTLILLIKYYSKPYMGNYRYLMQLFAFFNMVYVTVHLLAMPMIYIHEYSYVVFPTSVLVGTMDLAHYGMVLYAMTFCWSLLLLAYHFIYRYLLICKNNYIFIFHNTRCIFLLFLIWLALGAVYGFSLHFNTYLNDEFTDYLREALWKNYEFDVSTTGLCGLWIRFEAANGEIVWRVDGVLGFVADVSIAVLTFTLMAFCAHQIYHTLQTAAMSEKSRKLQIDLFKALLVQTLVPVVCEYIPFCVTYLSPMFHFGIGQLTNAVPIALSVYPVVDAACITYFIKDYRFALLRQLRCSAFQVYGSSSEQRENTVSKPHLQIDAINA